MYQRTFVLLFTYKKVLHNNLSTYISHVFRGFSSWRKGPERFFVDFFGWSSVDANGHLSRLSLVPPCLVHSGHTSCSLGALVCLVHRAGYNLWEIKIILLLLSCTFIFINKVPKFLLSLSGQCCWREGWQFCCSFYPQVWPQVLQTCPLVGLAGQCSALLSCCSPDPQWSACLCPSCTQGRTEPLKGLK